MLILCKNSTSTWGQKQLEQKRYYFPILIPPQLKPENFKQSGNRDRFSLGGHLFDIQPCWHFLGEGAFQSVKFNAYLRKYNMWQFLKVNCVIFCCRYGRHCFFNCSCVPCQQHVFFSNQVLRHFLPVACFLGLNFCSHSCTQF